MSYLQRVWQHILKLGDVSGKVMTLIALPSAVYTVIEFQSEIVDTFSRPDVFAKVENVGLRCGPYIDRAALERAVERGADPETLKKEQCTKADLSAWVKLTLTNEDAINRTLARVAFRITFPEELRLTDSPVTWTETRVVSHIIETDIQTTQRWPWTAMLLAPGTQVPLELDFRRFRKDDQIPFINFLELIEADPSALSDTRIPVEILGGFSGSDGWQLLGQCEIDVPKGSVDRKRTANVIRSLTRRCVAA
ncbi:MAG: hypothetical protein ACRBBQ_15880 [Cognatishimia sp.]